MEELFKELKEHIQFQKTAKKVLDSDFLKKLGFTQNMLNDMEKRKLEIGNDFVDSWGKLIGNNEIIVVSHIKNKSRLIMPEPDEIHVYLITRNIKTKEENREDFFWIERSSPLLKEELL